MAAPVFCHTHTMNSVFKTHWEPPAFHLLHCHLPSPSLHYATLGHHTDLLTCHPASNLAPLESALGKTAVEIFFGK
jgi:hypothetical protein